MKFMSLPGEFYASMASPALQYESSILATCGGLSVVEALEPAVVQVHGSFNNCDISLGKISGIGAQEIKIHKPAINGEPEKLWKLGNIFGRNAHT
jgi:hypothetical protein